MGRSGTSSLASCLSSGKMGFSCAQEPYILSSGMYKNLRKKEVEAFKKNFCQKTGRNGNQVKIDDEKKLYESLDFLFENYQSIKHVYSNQVDFINFHIIKYCKKNNIKIIHLYRKNIFECALSNILISQTGLSGNSVENKNVVQNFNFEKIDIKKLDKTIRRLTQRLKKNKKIIKSIVGDDCYEIEKEVLYSNTYKKRQGEFKKICKYLKIDFNELDLNFVKKNVFGNNVLYGKQSIYKKIPNYKEITRFQNEKFII